jgi:hypothetical protein
MSGKGSGRRPLAIDAQTAAENWQRTFGGRVGSTVPAGGEAAASESVRASDVPPVKRMVAQFLVDQTIADHEAFAGFLDRHVDACADALRDQVFTFRPTPPLLPHE